LNAQRGIAGEAGLVTIGFGLEIAVQQAGFLNTPGAAVTLGQVGLNLLVFNGR